MGKYLDLAEPVDLGHPTAPPPDELGKPCPACGTKEKWRWLDGRLVCRTCLIQRNPPPTTATATTLVLCPRIVYTDLNSLMCKIWFPSPAHGA
jgi:hypothetical protein